MHPIRAHFATQAEHCDRLGSPFYGHFLRACAAHLSEDTAVERQVLAWPGDARADALALRFAGALRHLALTANDDTHPEVRALAAVLEPGCPPAPTGELDSAAWDAVQAALRQHGVQVQAFLARAVQTNEVRRCFALLAGFLHLSERYQKPLSLYEIGASAGLNLLWDRWHYQTQRFQWGDPAAPVRLETDWRGPLPARDLTAGAAPVVALRRACDLHPLDVRDPAERARLLAYLWPDQPERTARAVHALDQFVASEYRVEQGNAPAWLDQVLARDGERARGTTTVVYHSIMLQYLTDADREALADTLTHRGHACPASEPLVWLRFEPAHHLKHAELTATHYPGEQREHLADADYHGRWITWRG